jgi:hypothetical protein
VCTKLVFNPCGVSIIVSHCIVNDCGDLQARALTELGADHELSTHSERRLGREPRPVDVERLEVQHRRRRRQRRCSLILAMTSLCRMQTVSCQHLLQGHHLARRCTRWESLWGARCRLARPARARVSPHSNDTHKYTPAQRKRSTMPRNVV